MFFFLDADIGVVVQGDGIAQTVVKLDIGDIAGELRHQIHIDVDVGGTGQQIVRIFSELDVQLSASVNPPGIAGNGARKAHGNVKASARSYRSCCR